MGQSQFPGSAGACPSKKARLEGQAPACPRKVPGKDLNSYFHFAPWGMFLFPMQCLPVESVVRFLNYNVACCGSNPILRRKAPGVQHPVFVEFVEWRQIGHGRPVLGGQFRIAGVDVALHHRRSTVFPHRLVVLRIPFRRIAPLWPSRNTCARKCTLKVFDLVVSRG